MSKRVAVGFVLLCLLIPAAFVLGVVSGRSMTFDGHDYSVRRGPNGLEIEIASQTHLGMETRIVHLDQHENIHVHTYLDGALIGVSILQLPIAYDSLRLMHHFILMELDTIPTYIGFSPIGRQISSGCDRWWVAYWDEMGLVYRYAIFVADTDNGEAEVTEYRRVAADN